MLFKCSDETGLIEFSEITVIPDGRTDFFEVASKKISLFRSGTCVLVTASTGWLF